MGANFFSSDTAIPGFTVPLHRALTEPILLGGAPRAVAPELQVAGAARAPLLRCRLHGS